MPEVIEARAPAASRQHHVALSMLAGWMGERFFRTFRPRLDEPTVFDALIGRREARIGVTFGLLWGDDPAAHADVIATKQKLGRKAIGAIERRGAAHDFLVADRYSVADICLYGYTHMAGQAGIDLAGFPAVAASYFVRLRLDESRVDPTYVWAAMNSAAMKRRLFTMARGAIGQANINARELMSIPLPVPPAALQRRYAETVEATRAVARVGESSTRIAATLMTSLMSEMCRGGGSKRGTP